jgi:hypothetical protein
VGFDDDRNDEIDRTDPFVEPARPFGVIGTILGWIAVVVPPLGMLFAKMMVEHYFSPVVNLVVSLALLVACFAWVIGSTWLPKRLAQSGVLPRLLAAAQRIVRR